MEWGPSVVNHWTVVTAEVHTIPGTSGIASCFDAREYSQEQPLTGIMNLENPQSFIECYLAK
jgi:hypothetical protein